MRRLYLVGRMNHAENADYGRKQFTEAAARWRAAGYDVFSAYEIHEELGMRSRRIATAYDLPALCHSDVLVALPGWRQSRLCRVEVHLAEALNIEVIDEDPIGRSHDARLNVETRLGAS